jgi:hypothetical protein
MSQRMGQADGRCFSIATSAKLLNNYIMQKNNIAYSDNYSYRKLLQTQGPNALKVVQDQQKTRSPNRITVCDKALLNVSNIY